MEANLEQLNDMQLIALFKNHDERGFNVLYSRYRSSFFGYLLKIMPGNRCTVEDIFQESWRKVIANINKYDHQEKFLAWLCRIGHNLAMDFFRRSSRREQEVELNDDIDYPSLSLEQQAKAEASREQMAQKEQKLQEAILRLPAEQQEVIRLRSEGVSFKEIAERQNIQLNTALGRMHKALVKLKKMVNESCGGTDYDV